jgi:hypothetical protein
VESLESHETRTGNVLFEFLQGHELVRRLGMPIEYKTCETFRDFVAYLGELEVEIGRTGHAPLLHVECHGDEVRGLEFANGSNLAWAELSTGLVRLNEASGFNLVAVFSACYGGHFLGHLSSINPAPCYAMIAPTETVEPSEILAAFRTFYSVLFARRDVGVAIAALARQRLSKGWWFGQHAELWFEKVTIGYVQNH